MKQALRKAAAALAGWVPDALLAGGAIAVAFGASLIYQPAGYITGGLFAIAGGWLLARGGK